MRRSSRSIAWPLVVAVVLLAACSGGSDRAGTSTSRPGPSKPSDSTGPTVPDSSQTDGAQVIDGSFDGLIPRPTSLRPTEGRFVLTAETKIIVAPGSGAEDPAGLLRDILSPAVGSTLTVSGVDAGVGPVIELTSSGADDELGDEGYELRITPDRVVVVARTAAGFRWGIQTIRQIAAPVVEASEPADGALALPAGVIRDIPRWPWRGVMFDIARHFFGPDDIERVIDLLAMYKLNVLHLHLSDDQGWRIEIEAYPELTAVGAQTEVGGGEGGFLTKADYKRLVTYAARRGITIVPEIDMPGHTNAALVSLPWLNCDGVAPEPYTGTHVGFSSLCIGGERTDEFVDTVVGELADMTPGPFIHIGGDESHSTEPADFRRFIESAVRIVRDHGKTPIGWEEIGQVDIGANAVAQHWLKPEHAVAAAAQGARVILSPAPLAYYDMKLDESMEIGNSWAGIIDTHTAYDWDPATRVPGLDESSIVGVEAPLWSETFSTLDEAERLLLPRLPGLAELGWSGPGDWDSYRVRLATQAPRWTAAGRSYTADPEIDW